MRRRAFRRATFGPWPAGIAALLLTLAAGPAVVGLQQAAAPAAPAPAASDLRALARQSLATIAGELSAPGLKEPVEVLRDRWGVPHLYARNTDDLFFAQGYVTAQDRLWQMEWWRRSREGRLAEVLGVAAFDRDRQARLLKYRGPMNDAEWTSYHPEGKRIFTAFANGVNAYIRQVADNLPVEFKLTGIRPEPWTAETLVLRSPGFGDAAAELRLAMSVAQLGVQEANRRAAPDPWDDLQVPDGLDVTMITDTVIEGTRAAGALPRPEIVAPYRTLLPQSAAALWMPEDNIREPGSNNWVMSGAMSITGKPIVSNDPHREVTNPSLRYIVHLNAPGWNVVGSSEPPFVGVAIGHSDRLAWGLTIVGTDFTDVFVEDLNPANPAEILYKGQPDPIRTVREEIRIKGEAARTVEMQFTRHGPVFHTDRPRNKAYVLRSIFTEPGTASYLGGLRLSQARDCREFLAEAMYWKAPSENLICGDVEGNIAWQASALTPNRRSPGHGASKAGWTGRLPVPGTGAYEWDGFRSELPKSFNPPEGFIATANHNINPPGYWPPVAFKTTRNAEFDRIVRLRQLITPGRRYSMEDHQRFQHDAKSLRGAADKALFQGWTAKDPAVEHARGLVAGWDAMLAKASVPGAIYQTWRDVVDPKALDAGTPAAERRPLVEAGLRKAIDRLSNGQGPDPSRWRWGRMHTRDFPHPVLNAFDLPTVERGGGAGAVAADGASYREIIDVSAWDRSLTINTPGQSGQPESEFYGNLLPLWADNQYFPMVFSRSAVEGATARRLRLRP